MHRCSIRSAGMMCAAMVIAATTALRCNAQCEIVRLDGAGLKDTAGYGRAVAIADDIAVIGLPDATINGVAAGIAAVYQRNRTGVWQLSSVLRPTDAGAATAGQEYGFAVATDGQSIAIGAPGDGIVGADGGACFMYTRSNDQWILLNRLISPDGDDSRFGAAVAVDADRLLVGAPRSDAIAANAGIVHTFSGNAEGWSPDESLVPDDINSEHRFGQAVALDGVRAVAGSPRNGGGMAYIFQRVALGWIQITRLDATGTGFGDRFGTAVDVAADRALVGSPLFDAGGTDNIGRAVLFELGDQGWTQAAVLRASGPADDDNLGATVGLGHDRAYAGSGPLNSVIRFQPRPVGNEIVWSPSGIIRGSASLPGAAFGAALDVDLTDGIADTDAAEQLLIGAPDEPDAAAYVFNQFVADCNCNGVADAQDLAKENDFDCNLNGVLDSCDIDSGTSTDCNTNGIPDDCDINVGRSSDANKNEVPDECDPVPDNNDCLTPTIVNEGSQSVNNAGAIGNGPSEVCGDLAADVWYRYIATCAGTLRIRLCNADFPAELALYNFICPAAANTALDCDTAASGIPEVEFPVPGPGLYRIRIGSADGTFGSGTLVIRCFEALPCPEDCAGEDGEEDGDGVIDILDLFAVINEFGVADPGGCDVSPVACDFTIGNGVVNIDDILAVIDRFGPCPN